MSKAHAPKTPAALAALTLGALGVVYGDIGTSPLYALKEVFHAGHVPTTSENILGVLSLIFWTMTIMVVTVKYVLRHPAGQTTRAKAASLALLALIGRKLGEGQAAAAQRA